MEVNFQIVADNINDGEIKVLKLFDNEEYEVTNAIRDVVAEVASVEFTINIFKAENIHMLNQEIGKANLIIINNLLGNKKVA